MPHTAGLASNAVAIGVEEMAGEAGGPFMKIDGGCRRGYGP